MTNELAIKLLDETEELLGSEVAEEQLLAAITEIENLQSEDTLILCRSARLLFRYGIFYSKGRFFLLALDKLKLAEEKDPFFFDITPIWCQLWGNILIQLGKLLNDSSFFESALSQYQRALQIAIEPEIFWDIGDAWTLLAQYSQDPTDVQQAIGSFYKAYNAGLNSHFFLLDYGSALTLYSKMKGDPSLLDEAISYYKNILSVPSHSETTPTLAYLVAWRKYALTCKIRYHLCHTKESFESADSAFKEAILEVSRNSDLWLDWGELYLYAGWIKREPKLIEIALEKLTSTKIKDCDPLKVSTLLGMGLVMYGLFLENLKLIKDGQERLKSAAEVAPNDADLTFACAFAELGVGLYFSNEANFAKAAQMFEQEIQKDATSCNNLHALFQCYMAWGSQQQEACLVQKGLQAIARLCELRSYSSIHLNEWGVALLRLRQLEPTRELAQGYIEEAIDKFQRAWELNEEDETLYNWGCAFDLLGDITADEDDYAKAIDLLTKIYEKKPGELHVRYHLGIAFSHLGELNLNADCLIQAIELLDSVAKADPDEEGVWCDLGYTFLNLSELIFDSIYPDEGRKTRHEAEKALLRAAELGSGDACYHLACLYSLSGLPDAAMSYLRKAEIADCLPCKEDLEHDEWLEGIRHTEAFHDFLTSQGDNG